MSIFHVCHAQMHSHMCDYEHERVHSHRHTAHSFTTAPNETICHAYGIPHTLRLSGKYYYLQSRTPSCARTHQRAHLYGNLLYRKVYNKKKKEKKRLLGVNTWTIGQAFRRSDHLFVLLSFAQFTRPHHSVSQLFRFLFTSYLFILIKHHISIN